MIEQYETILFEFGIQVDEILNKETQLSHVKITTLLAFKTIFNDRDRFDELTFVNDTTVLNDITILPSQASRYGYDKLIREISWETIEFLGMLQRSWFKD